MKINSCIAWGHTFSHLFDDFLTTPPSINNVWFPYLILSYTWSSLLNDSSDITSRYERPLWQPGIVARPDVCFYWVDANSEDLDQYLQHIIPV